MRKKPKVNLPHLLYHYLFCFYFNILSIAALVVVNIPFASVLNIKASASYFPGAFGMTNGVNNWPVCDFAFKSEDFITAIVALYVFYIFVFNFELMLFLADSEPPILVNNSSNLALEVAT